MRTLALGVAVLLGCGNAPGSATSDAASGSDAGSTTIDAPPDAVPYVWQPLISDTWTQMVFDGSTNAFVQRVAIMQEMWIDGFRPTATSSPGNDHQLVSVSTCDPMTYPDACPMHAASVGTLPRADTLIYASGFDHADVVELPAGTAVHLTPTTNGVQNWLVLTNEVSNDTGATLNADYTSTSGVEYHAVADPATVAHPVEMILGGEAQTTTIPAHSTKDWPGLHITDEAITIVALWPHMHAIGTHQKVEVQPASTGPMQTVIDVDYSVSSQSAYPMAISLPTESVIKTTCSYDNTTAATITLDNATQEVPSEICWVGFYKYPVGGMWSDPYDYMDGFQYQ